ncbi:cytochrome oxidase putative small subunit CydP [Dyella sedimenti]|uniref:cytochrome oxidase putative small subunit CydP n=1 Tax=Dyella sedimenti TaxID=2919947 RepID=UPI001FA99A8E|nr:cytochrome oxidase putative small subunit CydP [Dyella sedimenti]
MSMPSVNPVRVELSRRPLRRLAGELVLLVLAKLVLLTLIWWVATAHYARPDTRPATIEHLLAPASASTSPHTDSP